MQKLKYEYDGYCKTECPHYSDGRMIGSYYCDHCYFFKKIDYEKQIVWCRHPENNQLQKLKQFISDLRKLNWDKIISKYVIVSIVIIIFTMIGYWLGFAKAMEKRMFEDAKQSIYEYRRVK